MTFIKNHILSLILTVVILLLSLLPIGGVELAKDVPLADKWTHMVMYATLSLALAWEYLRQQRPPVWLHFLVLVLLLPSLLGGLLELAQAYCTSYRSGEWLDFLADTIGAAVATAVAAVFFKMR